MRSPLILRQERPQQLQSGLKAVANMVRRKTASRTWVAILRWIRYVLSAGSLMVSETKQTFGCWHVISRLTIFLRF